MSQGSSVRDARAALALSRVPGVGPVTFRALVDALGSADAVLRAPESTLRGVAGCSRQAAKAVAGFDGGAHGFTFRGARVARLMARR